MKRVLLAIICIVLPASVMAQSASSLTQAVNSITPADVYRHIEVMAHDSMMGRDTPSPGLDMTADYVAAEFRRIGLLPGAEDGSYIQRYPLTEVRRGLTVAFEGLGSWEPGTDVAQMGGGATNGPVTGPLVVVTGGGELSSPAGLEGAIVLLAARWAGRGFAPESQTLIGAIQEAQPAVLVVSIEISDRFWGFFSGRQNQTQVSYGSEVEGADGAPLLFIRNPTAMELLAERGIVFSAEGAANVRTLADINVTVNATMETGPASAPNVVGILEGSDPTLKNEYVVLSAHMDHVGVTSQPVDGDSIRNGADDNASGTAGIIEAAEAMTMLAPAPKRSIIFLAVSGEETGLWGSAYYADNPSVPVSDIVANLNTDMIGRNWTDTIVAIGKEYSDLGETLDRVNAEHPELGMTAIDDIWPDERFYYRSDHYNFAEKGIPVLFFFNGTHEDYHGVNDEIDRVDTEKASRIVKLLFHLSVEIANSPERPQPRQTG